MDLAIKLSCIKYLFMFTSHNQITQIIKLPYIWALKICNGKSDSHIQDMPPPLRKLWSCSFQKNEDEKWHFRTYAHFDIAFHFNEGLPTTAYHWQKFFNRYKTYRYNTIVNTLRLFKSSWHKNRWLFRNNDSLYSQFI